MLALMAITPAHRSTRHDPKPAPRSKRHNGDTLYSTTRHRRQGGTTQGTAAGTHVSRERTFMDIFACRHCKKSKSRKGQGNCVENEGYSTDEDYYRENSQITPRNPQLTPTDPLDKPQLPVVKAESSRRRPLQCKGAFGKRNPGKKSNKSQSEESAGKSNFLETTWRSLPNLRSPSLAVRAMTLKFRTITQTDDSKVKTKTKTKKKARFNEAVDVILHDDNGEPLYTQIVKIKYDDEDSLDVHFGKMAAASQNGPSGSGSEPSVPANRRPLPDAIRMDFMDIKRNAAGQKCFKCVIFIGEEFDRRRITVRTAMGGSRLVLIAYKSEPLGDGSHYWQQFVEKFRLPHAIDPNQVNAVMHSAGDLVIEAPIFEFENNT